MPPEVNTLPSIQPKTSVPTFKRAPPLEEDASQHLWAVSYADMLMVLMSFFIIYFQFDEMQGTKDPLAPLAFALKEKLAQVAPQSKDSGTPKSRFFGETDASGLTILLREQAFAPGQYTLAGKPLQEFNELLQEVKPFLEPGFKLIVVGHVDEDANEKGAVSAKTISRFNLAALRASEAASLALAQGIPTENLGLEADLSHLRKSRSLSLRIASPGARPPVPSKEER